MVFIPLAFGWKREKRKYTQILWKSPFLDSLWNTVSLIFGNKQIVSILFVLCSTTRLQQIYQYIYGMRMENCFIQTISVNRVNLLTFCTVYKRSLIHFKLWIIVIIDLNYYFCCCWKTQTKLCFTKRETTYEIKFIFQLSTHWQSVDAHRNWKHFKFKCIIINSHQRNEVIWRPIVVFSLHLNRVQ